jgi:hypothetical protein
MRQLRIISLALSLLGISLFQAPRAEALGIYGGYEWPSGPAASRACTPTPCYGARIRFRVPTPIYRGIASEPNDGVFWWVGVWGNTSHNSPTARCTLGSGGNNPLFQFGIEPFILSNNAISYTTWWEAFPCNNVTNYGTLVINPDDQITLEFSCLSNCTTGNVNANWQMLWTNNTTGFSQSRTDTGNWTVYMDFAQVAVEQTGTGVDSAGGQPLHFTTPIRVWNVQVHQVGVGWVPMAVLGDSPASRITSDTRQIKSSPKTYETYYSSTAIDSDVGPSFQVCDNITQASSTPVIACPYSTYSGTFGLGP